MIEIGDFFGMFVLYGFVIVCLLAGVAFFLDIFKDCKNHCG